MGKAVTIPAHHPDRTWKKLTGVFLSLACDIAAAALILTSVWVFGDQAARPGVPAVLPQTNQCDLPPAQMLSASENRAGTMVLVSSSHAEQSSTGTLVRTSVKLDPQDWHTKFADHFTDTVVSTDTSYTSPDLSIQLFSGSYDSHVLDTTGKGKHKKYGTNVSYVLADIYVGDISCIQTAFADDTYGVGYSEKLTDMSDRIQSVLAVNGDSYNNNRHQDNGTIIRNGIIYRAQSTDMETCVLNWDGTMNIYQPEELDPQQLIQNGAYQSWIFGPSLLDENGKAKESFLTWDYIRQSHPRTAIGYYEPGHYCLLVVDGRQESSRGMFLDEMAGLFESLGCKAAYNLDGGHCSFMMMQEKVVSHPYKPEHKVPDGIFIMESAERQPRGLR